MQKKYTSIGLMSGTSGDGVDASIIYSNGIDKFEAIKDKYYEYDAEIYKSIHNFKEAIHSSKELKKFSLTNNYRLIPLDELIDENVDHLFFDKVHTNEKGSYYIANKIYPSLKRIIVSDLIEKKN